MLPSFFQNDRDGSFTQITTNAISQARKRSLGSTVGDFDNDGDDDIYYSGNAHPGSTEPRCDLFRNDGLGRFTRVTGPWQQDLDLTCDTVFVGHPRSLCLGGRSAPGRVVSGGLNNRFAVPHKCLG